MARSNEAFWWSLFSAGGVMAALFVPALIVATGFLLPTDDPLIASQRYRHLHAAVAWWPVRALLLVIVGLTFFHCAHRLRHTLMDVGLRRKEAVLKWACVSAALAGTVAAAYVLVRI